MPGLHLIAQHSIDHPLLLQHVDAPKLLRGDLNAVHGATAARYVLNHKLGGRELGGQFVPNLRLGGVEVVRLLGTCGRACRGI